MSCRFSFKNLRCSVVKSSISIFTIITTVILASSVAHANAKYAAIVIDGNTGKVLHARSADKSRYPASLTKIMTLYILFDYLKKGRLSYNTKFYVTPHAAKQPPSKLGLKPGSYIRVKDIIGALVTKSANDAAATVAENIAETEAKFAKLMTKTAKSLGMHNTVFRNASGLPHSRQRTTARDMAKLSMRIMSDFPRYSRFFKTRSYKYRGRRFRNHNGLLFSYKGTEGIKTGYTRASGFNLTSSVKRGRKHLIAVVLGGRTARSRNAEMRRLLNAGFPKAVAMSRKKSLQKRLANMDPSGYKKTVRYLRTVTNTSWKKNNKVRPASRKPSLVDKAYSIGAYTAKSGRNKYVIQVGAYEDRKIAVGKLSKIKTQAGRVLAGHQPYIMKFRKGGVNYHRARFAGFSSRGGAASACKHLTRKLKTSCIIMIP